MAKTKGEIQRDYEKKTNYAAQKEYAKKYKKCFQLACFSNTEQDIIDKLNSVPNKSGYIKALIREDIKRSSNN